MGSQLNDHSSGAKAYVRGQEAVLLPVQRVAKIPVWARARAYTEEAIEVLAKLMRSSESDVVRLTAADKLLDRAWGKAPMIVAGDESRPIVVDVRSYDQERLAALESALMQALAPALTQANASLTAAQPYCAVAASESQLPASVGDANVPGTIGLPASELPSASSNPQATQPERE